MRAPGWPLVPSRSNLVVFFGFLVVLQSAGIDLSALTVLSGTIGIGIGFGLQNIANNFFSGIIILLERPVKVGDRIQVGMSTAMWWVSQSVRQPFLRTTISIL